MFSPYTTTRRWMFRTAFFALCLLPTCGVIVASVWLNRSGATRAQARYLSRATGLVTSVASMRRVRPGVTVYEGLHMTEPESGDPVLAIRRLDVGWRGETLVLVASDAEVFGDRWAVIWDLLLDNLRRGVDGEPPPVRLVARRVTLQAADATHVLDEITGRSEKLSEGYATTMTVQMRGAPMAEKAKLRIVRDIRTGPATTNFELRTGDTALPCSLFDFLLGASDWLGTESRFRGYVWASHSSSGWAGELTGQVERIELHQLADGRFDHTLDGKAEVTLTRVRFANSRLQEATGSLNAGPGSISGSLFLAAAESLGTGYAKQVTSAEQTVPYDWLAVDFSLDETGLQLNGRVHDAGAGVIIADRYGALLGQPPNRQPLGNLVRMLYPGSSAAVPLDTAAEWLVETLPLARGTPNALARQPRAPLRQPATGSNR